MPLKDDTWEQALRKMQPAQQGGVQPPGKAGNMGNMAYAPGMMQFTPQSPPTARAMMGSSYRQETPPGLTGGPRTASEGPVDVQGPGGQGAMIPPPMAMGLMGIISRIISQNINRRQRGSTY